MPGVLLAACRRRRPGASLLAAAALTTACSTPAPPPAPPPAPAPAPVAETPPPAGGRVLGRGERLLVYQPREGDTLPGIAARFLGSADRAWQIAELNGDIRVPTPGRPLVLPLAMPRPLGVSATGVQTVPILCYHRIGPGPSKMTVAAARFESQLEWLAANGWHVVRLSDLLEFMAGRKALPRRSVVITFDDGYESVYRHAFALLKKHGVPATLFVYSDFLGAGAALSWPQLNEMTRSGLVDVQAHSKSHRNLTERGPEESDAAYRHRLDVEFRQPRVAIERGLGAAGQRVRHFAYPYGDANQAVIEALLRNGYDLGLTVNPGGNPFYASPWLLRRVMIYGDHDLQDFQARLAWRPPVGWP